MRYPAYPIIAHDPYFSAWSMSDKLNESWTKHWTGSVCYEICGLIRIDGKPYRYMGDQRSADPMQQTGVELLPTRAIYTFEANGVQLKLTFMTPTLPQKLDILSRPVTYVCYQLRALDGKKHDIATYLDFGSEICLNDYRDKTLDARYSLKTLDLLAFTPEKPDMLGRSGDDLRINWGYFYMGLPKNENFQTSLNNRDVMRNAFIAGEALPESDSLESANPDKSTRSIAASAIKHVAIAPDQPANYHLLVAYDDLYCIEFLHQRLQAYWRRNGKRFAQMLLEAEEEFKSLQDECVAFDTKLLADATACGGKGFADLCAGAYRQSFAAHKLVADLDGTPLFFSKECFSNGCIATVDITYPSAPLYLLLQPELVKGMMIPILKYAALPRWKFPFAPHDLGTYPLANGQVYGGGEKTEKDQMPVEECGNMIIIAGALVKYEHDTAFAETYWDTLHQWAKYLLDKGYDPENQLCTDDFAGHLAHNTNLSIKAIMALGAFSQIADALGKKDIAQQFMAAARQGAERWQKDARDDNGVYRLAFDQEGSWSQKYNLVWDTLLELNLFSKDVAKRELAFYRTHQQEFGLPLDSRKTYTKLDWILWSACLTESQEDFQALLAPVLKFLQETPKRVPMGDWYETTDAKPIYFQARAVVGGVFLKLLYDPAIRQSYR